MSAWSSERRDDPSPCRAQDHGRFEVTQRDGRARLGKLHTRHGVLETPALLPVVNPNIRTIRRERCGTSTASRRSTFLHRSHDDYGRSLSRWCSQIA